MVKTDRKPVSVSLGFLNKVSVCLG